MAKTTEVKLNNAAWQVDYSDQLGPEGGFGAVFKGYSQDGKEVAIKRLKVSVDDLAHREMEVADFLIGSDFEHVIKVYDAGKDADSDHYFVIMEKAERSLQDLINESAPLEQAEAVEILSQAAKGLMEIGEVVHRDIKPANILFEGGKWKIADFGIARFVEKSTSLETLKGFLSEQFAAPEQWDSERASPATDIYALGCIAHCLLKGTPPFSANSRGEYKTKHCSEMPPQINGVSARLRSLVTSMLRKSQESRPGAARVLNSLGLLASESENDQENDTKGDHALSVVNANVVEEQTRLEAEAASREREAERRQEIALEAVQTLNEVAIRLKDEISELAPDAAVDWQDGSLEHSWMGTSNLTLALSHGSLNMTFPKSVTGQVPSLGRPFYAENPFTRCDWDVLTTGLIKLTNDSSNYSRSAALYFGSPTGDRNYRWYELSFWALQGSRDEPFAQFPDEGAENALGNRMHDIMPNGAPRPIDDEDTDDFVRRWVELFTSATQGSLGRPSSLPER